METNDLILKKLKKVKKVLERIPSINEGGCGYSALAMYLWLKKHKYPMENVSFVYLYSHNGYTYQHNENIFNKKKRGKPTSCSHVMININGTLHDSNSLLDSKSQSLLDLGFEVLHKHENINVKQLKKSLSDDTSWNSCFHRETALPIISKKLGIKM